MSITAAVAKADEARSSFTRGSILSTGLFRRCQKERLDWDEDEDEDERRTIYQLTTTSMDRGGVAHSRVTLQLG